MTLYDAWNPETVQAREDARLRVLFAMVGAGPDEGSRPWREDLQDFARWDTRLGETIAARATTESGLDDRPRCDPRVMAAGYLGLALLPWPRTPPRLVGGVIWYPSDAPPQAQAYVVAHECGHELARLDAPEVPRGAFLEALCSRIGRALLLPRRAFLRDVTVTGGDLYHLAALWPLCAPEVIAARVSELLGRAAAPRRPLAPVLGRQAVAP